MWGHVDDRLAAFCEGALTEAEARSVATHLALCARCERMRADTEKGLQLLRSLPAAVLDEDRARAIRSALHASPAAAASPMVRRLLATAAVLFAIGGAGLWLHRSPRLVLEPAAHALSPFETEAATLLRQADQGGLELDLVSDSPSTVRRWVRDRTGLGTTLAVERPDEDAGRFQVLGAKAVTLGAVPAVAVVYRIDARPAVLLTARAGDVPGGPREWTLAGKTVRHHVDQATGVKLLSWTNSGQIYSLASRLPGHALESCFVCHADPERRRLIRGIGAPPPAQESIP